MNGFKNFIKNNKISVAVVSSLLLISLIGILFLYVFRTEGNLVTVTINNKVVAKYDINKNATYSLNGGTNEITVEDGVVYMSYSSCPGHDCEGFGKIKYVGQSITCAPHDIVVSIEVGEGAERPDDAVDFTS